MLAINSVKRSMTVLLSALLMLPLAVSAQDSLPDPAEMVESQIDEIMTELERRQSEMSEDPSEAYDFIEELLLPVFDVPYATRLVLGRHGRDASPAQRRAFGEAFYKFLVRSYAEGLVEYDPNDIEIEVQPTRGEPDPDRARVRTEIIRDGADDIPVDFTLRYSDDKWQVYDVTVEGVSYITNYRNSFDSEIRQRGLDEVIERLEKRAAEEGEALEEDLSGDNGDEGDDGDG